jgi:hypothetical protein
MLTMEVTGMGAIVGGSFGAAALALRLGLPAAASPDGNTPAAILATFKRRTQQRYLDDAVGVGLAALNGASETAPEGVEAVPERTGLLLATLSGPINTRAQFRESYTSRGKRSASATLFANCGYNIVGAMLARSHNIRGPALTFGTGEMWCRRLLATARRMFEAGRIDRLFIGNVEVGCGVILALAPCNGAPPSPNPRIAFASDGISLLHPESSSSPLAVPDDELLWHLALLWQRPCRAADA